ncbi:tyrosine-protein phosphatase [Desulfolucanica intricata]|uniref:tyrosine-protein phosphatase n=1 Tax=Desulfolucanica intricata TaxID=1285191 RepID=UPI000831479B|nr:CpsB/CapC family capsule biosynthesis tyrosine phosphatase [Desulfolucanica intricata]
MIDIHSHILPGLDDGAADLGISLEMARSAAGEGVRAIVATPHYIPGVYKNDSETVLKSVDKLNSCIQKEKIPLTVIPGVEAYIDILLPSRVKNKEILTINNGGKYLLIEFPMSEVPNYSEQVIFELMLSGITPIIAHPERNKAIINNPRLLFSLLNKGALVQLTAASLKGVWGKSINELAVNFLKLGWVHFIATDAHSPSGSRSLSISKVVPDLEAIIGEEQARSLIFENPNRVIKGVPITVDNYAEYPKGKKRGWKKFFWFFK